MEQSSTIDAIQFTAAATIPIGLVTIISYRCITDRGISVRVIQLIALITIVPVILVLALQKILSGEIVGTLFGALAGYLFSDIGKYKRSKRTEKKKRKNQDNQDNEDNEGNVSDQGRSGA